MKLGRISSHARARLNQRGLSIQILEALMEYGRFEYDRHGGKIVTLNQAGRKLLAKTLPAGQIDRCADLYAVLDAHNEVITVGQRSRRDCRH